MTNRQRVEYREVPPNQRHPKDCTCREVLVDHVQRTVTHPYYACPWHGITTTIDP